MLELRDETTTVVLVEGVSDAAAIEALASVSSVDLASFGTRVIPMGGATNIRRFAEAARTRGFRMLGLVDSAEARFFARALGVERSGLASVGFFVCEPDLEAELIRALGEDRAIEVIASHGDGERWATFVDQPFQRARSTYDRLHRFFGTTAGRKESYGRSLVESLGERAAPAPLSDLLAAVIRGAHEPTTVEDVRGRF